MVRSFLISSMSFSVLFAKIRLYFRSGLSIFSYSYEILPDYLSGASCLKAKLIKSIYSDFGRTRSSILAIIVESMPPENRTATLAPLFSLYELYGVSFFTYFFLWYFLAYPIFFDPKSMSLIHFVSSLTLSISNFLHVLMIYSSN